MKTIFKNRFIEIYGEPRKTPNEFTELGDAIQKFKDAVYYTMCRIMRIKAKDNEQERI